MFRPVASARALRALSLRSTVVLNQPVAHSHTLNLPDAHAHEGLTQFENGVPVDQVRDLKPEEKKWDFWTSSDAFSGAKPESGLNSVPFGQAWVIQRGGSAKAVTSGSTLILPLVDKVKAVKNTHPIAMGVVTPVVSLKDGSSVNAYAVAYVKVTDYVKSTLYVDPETNKTDSERAAAKLIRKTLEQELPSVLSGRTISDADKAKIEEKIKSVVAAKSGEYGLEVTQIEFRGVFDSSSNVPDKIRALDAPQQAPDAPGHGLSADYWQDVLSPPYFEKKKFGSRREPKTPATVTLEWVIPSPPDYHHFNELPRMTAQPSTAKAVKSAH